jgi:hypothetical protein
MLEVSAILYRRIKKTKLKFYVKMRDSKSLTTFAEREALQVSLELWIYLEWQGAVSSLIALPLQPILSLSACRHSASVAHKLRQPVAHFASLPRAAQVRREVIFL